MPGHKVYLQDGGEIREGLTCSYCKLVLKDPVQTTETGLRLCRECFGEAGKDPTFASELDPNDEIWPDFAVKREIANLKVKCNNYMIGCDWEGLFKQLMQHLQECQYVTVECRDPGCGQQVLLSKLEFHLKEECPQRRVNCKDCGKEMYFIERQNHKEECPNAPKVCKNCKKKMPASMLADHMINECKHVRCVCNEDKTYEAGSTEFLQHLQDVSKLADHLGPMISEFTKMSESFKEMSAAYQQATKRIDTLEKKNDELEKILEKRSNELKERVGEADEVIGIKYDELEERNKMLEKKVETLERENEKLKDELYKLRHHVAPVPSLILPGDVESYLVEYERRFEQIEERLQKQESTTQDLGKGLAEHNHDNSSLPPPSSVENDQIKPLEEKVLEVERTLNVLSVHHSELELQLQASLASTHNGAFLWRIPEVRQRMRDAKIGHITSIYSPPFYTGRNGYKMCIRAYLNGDGTGEGTHLSIFFVLMKGEYDPLLQWPFEYKVSLILVDQDHMKHLVQTFKPNPQSSSFQKPKSDMNVASGCPEFADLSILENPSYVKDDVMYIKAIVDTSKIFHP